MSTSGAFLVGGLARLASIAISGPPKAFYSAMLAVELAVPLVVFDLTCTLPQSS